MRIASSFLLAVKSARRLRAVVLCLGIAVGTAGACSHDRRVQPGAVTSSPPEASSGGIERHQTDADDRSLADAGPPDASPAP